ncbi:MAG: hypothetical protein ACON4N_15090 [Myxococcota bacterium]
MNAEEQRAFVMEHLSRREQIAQETRDQIEQHHQQLKLEQDPLQQVDPAILAQAEDDFYAERGRTRYTTSDGRVLFLTDTELQQRSRAKSASKSRRRPRYYGVDNADSSRWWLTWGFNVGAVGLALIMVYVILS